MSLERQKQLQKLKKDELIELIGEIEESLLVRSSTIRLHEKKITDLERSVGAAKELLRKSKSEFDAVNMKVERIRSAIYMAFVFYPSPEQVEDKENPGFFIDNYPSTNENKMLNQFLSIVGNG